MPATRGSFKKGQCGNPKGRPKGFGTFRALCRERSPAALEMIDKALAGKPFPMALEAAKTVLAYAWGKPPQAITGEGGEGPVLIQGAIRFDALTDQQLAEIEAIVQSLEPDTDGEDA